MDRCRLRAERKKAKSKAPGTTQQTLPPPPCSLLYAKARDPVASLRRARLTIAFTREKFGLTLTLLFLGQQELEFLYQFGTKGINVINLLMNVLGRDIINFQLRFFGVG